MLSDPERKELIAMFKQMNGKMVHVQREIGKNYDPSDICILYVFTDEDCLYLMDLETENIKQFYFDELQDVFTDDDAEIFEDEVYIHIRFKLYDCVIYDFKNVA